MEKGNRHTKEAMFSMDRKLKSQRKEIDDLREANRNLARTNDVLTETNVKLRNERDNWKKDHKDLL